jgi:aminoglycoside 6'-N-acetyltransferase
VSLGFRPLERADVALLSRWLAAPHVAAWWREDPAPEAVEARYAPCLDGADPTELFVVHVDGRPVGMAQRYLFTDEPAWAAAVEAAVRSHDTGAAAQHLDGASLEKAAGIDYLIGVEEMTGRGLGSRMIDVFTVLTLERYPGVDRVIAAVQPANVASWRALEKAGFERVLVGAIDSGDPSDEGPAFVYVRRR